MKKLLILSGKGGTGKTTVSSSFIHFSKAEAFCDCDVDAPNLHIVENFSDKPKEKDFIGSKKAMIDESHCVNCGICANHCRFDSIKLIDGQYHINEYACEGCGVCAYICPNQAIKMNDDVAGKIYVNDKKRVFVSAKLKMGRGNSGKLVSEVKKTLYKNAPDKDLAIIDGSPGIGCPVIASLSGVDMVLLVSEPSLSGISDLKRIIKTSRIFNVKVVVCVNKYTVSEENTNKIIEYCYDNGLIFVGKIPYDKSASIAINNGHSIAEYDGPLKDALYEVYLNTMKELNKEEFVSFKNIIKIKEN